MPPTPPLNLPVTCTINCNYHVGMTSVCPFTGTRQGRIQDFGKGVIYLENSMKTAEKIFG